MMTTVIEQGKVDETEAVVENTDSPAENETLIRELESSRNAIDKLEQALAYRDSEIVELKTSLDTVKADSNNLSKTLAEAVSAYRELVLQTNPGILAEFITGNSVDEVNDSLKNAREVVERVRQEIDIDVSRTKVPAGAPQRIPLDISALSPREKIRHALEATSS
jgi:chromosome segregation ATPase